MRHIEGNKFSMTPDLIKIEQLLWDLYSTTCTTTPLVRFPFQHLPVLTPPPQHGTLC